MDGSFDDKLKAAFAKADAQTINSTEFVDGVVEKLDRFNRQRLIILGGAASIGSLIAASQLQRLANEFQFEAGLIAELFAVFPPEVIVSMALALIMTGFGYLLPANNR
jgi:putative NADH-flavin reductase